LEAGKAHGIAIGAEFKPYSNSDMLLKGPPPTFVVEELSDFESVMATTNSTYPGQRFSVIQTKTGKLEPFRLYIPPEDSFGNFYHSLPEPHRAANLQSVLLVDEPEEAHLRVYTKEDGHVIFVHTDKRVTQHAENLETDGVKLEPLIVESFLESAAHYFRELDRTSSSRIEDYIKVEVYKLDPPTTPLPRHLLLEQLAPIGSNLCQNNVITIMVDDLNSSKKKQTPYGFKIINSTEENLYVNAFYFDNMDFSIGESQCNFPLCDACDLTN
jgi:hypothetical protein